MKLEAYEAIAAAGGYGKKFKPQREPDPPKKQTRIKRTVHAIPKKLKQAVLETKGGFCFMGHCPNCGAGPVDIKSDFHHFIHRSKGGKDCIEHLWPCRRECHDYIHKHPKIERAMFKEIEAAGIPVTWKAETKGIGKCR